MELRDVLAALRAGWWLLLLGLMLGAGGAVAVSFSQTPMYTSSTQMFISTTESRSTSDIFQGGQFSQQRVTSYVRLLAGEELASRVVDRLGLSVSPTELSQSIQATAVADTVLIDVEVVDVSADRAQRVADAIGEEFPEMVTELEASQDGAASPVRVTVTERANRAETPSSPQPARNAVLGAALGLLVGAGASLTRARLDQSVKSSEVAAHAAGVPVIGTILRDAELAERHVVVRGGTSRTAEDYRKLRTNLQFLSVDQPPKLIMVSSAMPAEGKTTAVVNLALALADAGRSVVIVEADLRRPKVTRYLGMVGGAGLTNVLASTASLADVRQAYGQEGVTVVGAGPTPPNPGELLSSSQMAHLMEQLKAESDYVIVDAPPLLPVADASGLAVHMDGVLLVARYGVTTKEQLGQAAAMLDRVGATTLGVVFNAVPLGSQAASGYGYGYGYEPQPST